MAFVERVSARLLTGLSRMRKCDLYITAPIFCYQIHVNLPIY